MSLQEDCARRRRARLGVAVLSPTERSAHSVRRLPRGLNVLFCLQIELWCIGVLVMTAMPYEHIHGVYAKRDSRASPGSSRSTPGRFLVWRSDTGPLHLRLGG